MESDILLPGWKEQMAREAENLRRMMTDQSHDHVPVNPFLMGAAARVQDRTLEDYYTKPSLGVQCLLASQMIYDTMPNHNWLYAVYWAEDYGSKIKMPTGRMSAPAVVSHAAPTPELAEKIEPLSPEELAKAPTMKRHWEALETAEKLLGKDFLPWQFIYEMFVVASYWVGPENLIMWVYTEPELVKNLLKKVVIHSITAVDLVRDKYGKPPFVQCASLLANSSTLSPEQCREFNIVFLKEANEKIAEKGCAGIFYHLCGEHGQDYQLHDDCPFPPGSIFHVAYDGLKSADLTQVAKQFENKVALLGNTDTALIARGKPKEIYEVAYKQTMAYKHFKKGFIAALACECPPFAPPANIMAWCKGVRDAGNMKE